MILRLEALTRNYLEGQQQLCVIERLSYQFPESGTVAILGRSGVGKSTLLHLLGGLDRPSSGSIFFGEVDISKLDDEKLSEFRGKNVGFVFQFHHLLPDFSAIENVAMPLIIAGDPEPQALEKARLVLDRVGLSARLEHLPGQLSGGEQQRVAIARAIINEPRVVLADEPTGNLDQATADHVRELLFEENRKLKNLLLVVTHSHELAAQMDLVLSMGPGGELSVEQSRLASSTRS